MSWVKTYYKELNMSRRYTDKFIILLFAFTLALPVGAKNAGALELGVEADYWITNLSGTVKSDLTGVLGDKIDFKEDLGMKDENIAGGMLYFQAGKHRLTLRYAPLKYTGSKNITSSFTFNGVSYSATTRVNSTMELAQTDIQYTYWLLNMKTGARLGLVGAVKSVNAKTSLKAPAVSINEEQSISAAIPMVGLSAELGLGDLVRFKATGVGVAYNENSLFDVTAALEISPVPLFGITLGYRGVYLKVDSGDTEVKIDTTGAFVGLFAHF